MRYFRVTPQQDAKRAFDGSGAASSPGRWNRRAPEAFPYGDFNAVIDRAHADFARLRIGNFVALTIDERLKTIISPNA